jgi:hypothetical protein
MLVLKPYRTSFSLSILGPWILLLIWLVVQSCVFLRYEIQQPIDSDFYISNAQAILQGHFPFDRGLWYSSYSCFLAFVFWSGGNLITVVLFQLFLSGIAALALYKAVEQLFQNSTTAFLATLQYLLWIKIHQWNSYIYTESLFINFSIICFALLSLSKEKMHHIFTALIIIFTVFLRPTGIALFIATCAYLLYKMFQQKQLSIGKLLIIIASVFVILSIVLNAMLEEYIFYFIDSYSKAELIYPNINLGFSAPKQLTIPSTTHAPLLQLIEFIVYNLVYFLKLFIIKFLLFAGNMKPYFSVAHNIWIALVLYPIYTWAIYGFKKMEWSAENVWMSIFILIQTLTVSVTSENWDGRFLILILPFVFIYAAFGITTAWNNYRSR